MQEKGHITMEDQWHNPDLAKDDFPATLEEHLN